MQKNKIPRHELIDSLNINCYVYKNIGKKVRILYSSMKHGTIHTTFLKDVKEMILISAP